MISKISLRNELLILTFLLFILQPAAFSGNADDGSLRIVAGGDVMLGSWAQETIVRNGHDYPFRKLNMVLSDSDIMFANLEAPFGTGGRAFEKSYTFQVLPDLIQVLKAGRINVVSLANNHIMDFGASVLQQTMDLLKQNNIQYAGAGMNISQARKPAKLTKKGKKIIIASYSLTFPEEFWATDSTAGTCFPWHTFYYDDLRRFKKESDLLIISFHWGSELMETPKDYQIELAHKTINAGADLVIGHHPHVIQGIEIYKNKMIAYSLGNYIFGSFSENAKESMLLKFFFGTKGIKKCKIYPLNVYNKEVKFQPRFMKANQARKFLEKLNNISLELNHRKSVVSNGGWVNF